VDIWDFQRALSRRLLLWNTMNLVTGLILLRRKGIQRGIGTQAVGWSIINMTIAVLGSRSALRRRLQPDAYALSTLSREARNLRRLLWINAGLDILYMLGGWQLARRSGDKPVVQGSGWGIVIQGALLFVFDVVHARLVPASRR
jgi:hypothetical protein